MVGFEILTSVRYSGNGHELIITTARPSEAAAKQALILGDRAVQLGDGSEAWISNDRRPFPDTPNEVVLVRDGLIITIASDLSLDELTGLATGVVVS